MAFDREKYHVDLMLNVGHSGYGLSEAYIVYRALGEFIQNLLPSLAKYQSSGSELDNYESAISTFAIITSAMTLQENMFTDLLDKAELNAHPDRDLNSKRQREREEEQQQQYRELFKIAIAQKGAEQE